MVELIWDERFTKIYKKWSRQHPELKAQFAKRIVQFEEDPFHPSLKTHSLSGALKGLWSFRINLTNTGSFSILLMRAGQK